MSENNMSTKIARGKKSVPVAENVRPKRKRKNRSTSPPMTRSKCLLKKSPPPRECGICYQKVTERGLIQSCDHMFCFTCINTWVERSSTCPHCKRSIKQIVKTDVTGQKVTSKHKVVRRNLRDTLEQEEYQQRSRVLNPPEIPSQRASFLNNLTLPIPNQLLAAQQFLRDNVARMSTELNTSLYDLNFSLGNPNPFLPPLQTPLFPFSLDMYTASRNMNMDFDMYINEQIRALTLPVPTIYEVGLPSFGYHLPRSQAFNNIMSQRPTFPPAFQRTLDLSRQTTMTNNSTLPSNLRPSSDRPWVNDR